MRSTRSRAAMPSAGEAMNLVKAPVLFGSFGSFGSFLLIALLGCASTPRAVTNDVATAAPDKCKQECVSTQRVCAAACHDEATSCGARCNSEQLAPHSGREARQYDPGRVVECTSFCE